MTTPRVTIPIRPPVWTIHRDGPPPREGIRRLARLCLDVARKRLAARAAAARAAGGGADVGDDKEGDE
jgi:hypothetical protein